MIIATTDKLPGKEYEVLGMVKGNVVQSKHIGKDLLAGLKNIVGGEESMGADAVLMVRYGGAQIMESTAEIIAYGTAVKFV